MVRKSGQEGNQSASEASAADRGQDQWFSVSEAAELLGEPVTKVYDRIRDGRLRVRFHAGGGGDERPVVTSEELRRRASTRTRKDGVAMSSTADTPSRPDATAGPTPPRVTGSLPTPPARPPGEAPAAPVTVGEAERLRSTLAHEVEQRETLQAALERELADRRAMETDLRDQLQRQRERSEREIASRQEVERAKQRVEEEIRDLRQQLRTLKDELGRERSRGDEAEGKLDQSLKAMYDRDVKISRLEAQSEAGVQLRDKSDQLADRLQDRIHHLEEASELKEKEIRQLALGLGEARGEIRLLRAPQEEKPKPWIRFLPIVVVLAFAGILALVGYRLAAAQNLMEVALLMAAGPIAMFAAFFFRERWRRIPG